MKQEDHPLNTQVLVVDDRADIRRLIITHLELADLPFSQAEDGGQALALMKEQEFAVVILDWMMPGMEGPEVAQRIRKEQNNKIVYIIMLTARGSSQDHLEGLRMGVDLFITKPFDPEVLMMQTEKGLAVAHQRHMERQLRELNNLKDRFLGMAAHDLRNPLSAIRGYSELLLESDLDEEMRQEFLQAIHQVSNQMLGLVNDLLDVSVIESGHLQLRLDIIDLTELLRSRTALVAPVFAAKNIALEIFTPGSPRVRGDRDRLGQVIDNLLTNAAKFTSNHRRVQVRVTQEGETACLEVEDQGPGLQTADMDRLFGAFQKLSALPTGGEKSTGLGLSIVKKIVDAHNGTITAHNNPGAGCTFRLSLAMEK